MKKSGFTLVELSIVLVILGLLVGGVLSGQALIRASELRAVSNEFSQYQTALNAFRDKYFGLPGDLKNATSFWGAQDAASHNACLQAEGFTPQTCDGDGNGNIEQNGYEHVHAWKQLASAGLIEGSFNGLANNIIFGQNAPASRLSPGGWSFWYWAPGDDFEALGAPSGNMLFFGSDGNIPSPGWGPALTPQEAFNLDTKMDDGNPAQGKLRNFVHGSEDTPECLAVGNANFQLDSDTVSCAMIFLLQ